MLAGLCEPDAYKFIPQEPPASVEGLAERYRSLVKGKSPDDCEIWLNWVVRRQDDDYVGFIQATMRGDAATALIADHIFPSSWQQGYGREAVAAMLHYLIEAFDVHSVLAFMDTRNLASSRLVEALGFHQVRRIKNADFLRIRRAMSSSTAIIFLANIVSHSCGFGSSG